MNDEGRRSLDSNEGSKLTKDRNNYETLKNGVGQLAGRAKDYATEVSEKITEGYDEMRAKLKAYIGPIEEAEDFTVDNHFIIKGYRINHNTCKSLCKSLFTCHNEIVNVWSHIGGVMVFLGILCALLAIVIPTQNPYGKQLVDEYDDLGSGANPEVFLNAKVTELQTLQDSVQLSEMTSSQFESAMIEVMYEIEGISSFSIENFYTFDYLNSYAQQDNPSLDTLVDKWHTTITDYNAQMVEQLAISQNKIKSAGSKIDFTAFIKHRVS